MIFKHILENLERFEHFHLLRGFSSQRFVIPKHYFKTWSVNRTPSFALPTVKKHKLSSYPYHCTIFYVNKLTMLSAEVLNSRSSSLELGGHDTTQVATKMTKETKDKAHGELSSQRPIHKPTKDHMDLTREPEHKLSHQLFFPLVFL